MSFTQQTQHMEGNPHFQRAQEYLSRAEQMRVTTADELKTEQMPAVTAQVSIALVDSMTAHAQAEATLALAFEQRTRTLVAVRADSKHGFIRSIEAIQQRVMGGLNLR